MATAPSARANVSLDQKPMRSIVSVTIGHGTSLIAPSNSRNRITRPLRRRPDHDANLESGSVGVGGGITCSIRGARAIDERARRDATGDVRFFSIFMAALVPAVHD